MKILFYVNTLSHGGAERVLCNLANQFNNNEEVVMVTSYSVENGYELSSGIKQYFLENENLPSGVLKRNITRTVSLRKIIKSEKPDAVISFLPEPNFRAIAAAAGLKIPVIISVRNDPNLEYKLVVYRTVQKFLYPMASGIVFQTADAQKWFPEKIQKKSRVIMNQVDHKFFDIQKNEEKYYCALGRLVKQKNYKIMIEAFSEFSKKYRNAILKIYGVGLLRDDIADMIKHCNAEKNIFLMGGTGDVPSVLSNAKAFILSSDYEGMPNALLEAMAAGVPVISTDCPCGGPRTVIENNYNGILTSVGNSEDIKNALIKIESDKEFADMLGRNAKKTAEKFRPEIVFEQWKSYIQSIINM